jgi:hypothetical protein
MTTDLRPPGPPIKVAELLVPTVLTLAARGPASAKSFLAVLAGTRVTASPDQASGPMTTDSPNRATPPSGTRVTAHLAPAKAATP